jgi:phosphate transport system substrate-binding protein
MKRGAGSFLLPAVILGGLVAGCRSPEPPPLRSLVLTGAYPMAPLVQDIGQRFQADHAGIRVEVQAVGTARGISDTQQGLSDVGLIDRPLLPEESALQAFVLARDGVCFVVPRSNPVTALTDAQVAGILTRAIANWKQVGGPDAPITLVGESEGRSLAQVVIDHYKLKTATVRPDILAGDGRQILEAVAGRPHAIGYAPLGLAADASENLSMRLLPCGGVAATPANVANGTYPIPRPLLLVTREPPQGLVKEFIDFGRSAAVREVLDKYHLVPPRE